MAEGESEKMSGYRTAGIAANEHNSTFGWSKLPKDVQHKVLSYLPIQQLCQLRCVCREWRDVIHRRDFRSMYDTLNSSQEPSPAICYMESSYPLRLECCAYDYAGKKWRKMNSFPSLPRISLTTLNFRVHQYWPLNASLYSVGGLLCLHRWNFTRGYEFDTYSPACGVSSWTVWHPFRNRWKKLPPCKHKVGGVAPFFVHAFVSDERTKAYKILMAHDPTSHRNNFNHFDAVERRLVTEIYDSVTGRWTDGAEHTLQLYPGYRADAHIGLNRRGVLCNGVIYFATGRNDYWLVGSGPNVLLSYDIQRDEWHEEIRNGCLTHPALFEWDGRLMAVKVENLNRGISGAGFVEWDPAKRLWNDTGIEIPWKILDKFHYYSVGFRIVASGNYLAVTGYTDDDGFRIAVYRRAENYWRMPPTGAFSDKLKPAQVEGLVLHTPSLDWRP